MLKFVFFLLGLFINQEITCMRVWSRSPWSPTTQVPSVRASPSPQLWCPTRTLLRLWSVTARPTTDASSRRPTSSCSWSPTPPMPSPMAGFSLHRPSGLTTISSSLEDQQCHIDYQDEWSWWGTVRTIEGEESDSDVDIMRTKHKAVKHESSTLRSVRWKIKLLVWLYSTNT